MQYDPFRNPDLFRVPSVPEFYRVFLTLEEGRVTLSCSLSNGLMNGRPLPYTYSDCVFD